MQKLIIDTNVFVSYLISKNGFSYKIIDEMVLGKKALHFVSNETLKENFEVFGRTRFVKKYPEFSKMVWLLLTNLMELSVLLNPVVAFSTIENEMDNRFLELAHASKADCLITGNKLHFTFSQFHNTQIVSPREYWENYKPKKDD